MVHLEERASEETSVVSSSVSPKSKASHKSGKDPISVKAKAAVACVAAELNPGIVRLRSSDQKLVPAPRVLPGFSIIASNWLLHMPILSCTVIGRVISLNHSYAFNECQMHKINTAATTADQ